MLSITDALEEIVNSNPALQFGLQRKLLNLAQTAKFIQPYVNVRTKKEVTVSAIHMALSRAFKSKDKKRPIESDFEIRNVSVQSKLFVLTYRKSSETLSQLFKQAERITSNGGYWTMTHGLMEVTVIVSAKELPTIEKIITAKPKLSTSDVAAVAVLFSERYLKTPGLLHLILQQFAIQGINIVEVASSATELIVYIKEHDISVAFDTLMKRFSLGE